MKEPKMIIVVVVAAGNRDFACKSAVRSTNHLLFHVTRLCISEQISYETFSKLQLFDMTYFVAFSYGSLTFWNRNISTFNKSK